MYKTKNKLYAYRRCAFGQMLITLLIKCQKKTQKSFSYKWRTTKQVVNPHTHTKQNFENTQKDFFGIQVNTLEN